jgi:periplasmic protein CpxP/Spy
MNRTLVATSLALALTGGVALAQQPAPPADGQPHHFGHHRPNPHREAEHLSRMLNLSPDQTAKLEPIFANRDQQMEAIHGNGQLTQQAAREQMKALHQSTEQQLAGVLSPAQLQQMKQMHHGPHGPRGNWQQGGQPQPSGL